MRRHGGRVLAPVDPAARRRARAARWARRVEASRSLARCAELVGECAELVALVRRELERARDLDAGTRSRMVAVVREMLEVEELGRVAILAALLPPTGRHDA